jgi:hypothetical protein
MALTQKLEEKNPLPLPDILTYIKFEDISAALAVQVNVIRVA